jgi:hypothetical protein
LVSIHNFIRIHTPDKETHLEDGGLDHTPGGFYAGDYSLIPDGMGIIGEDHDGSNATNRRNEIADNMWMQYQYVLHQRAEAGLLDDETSSDESE